MKNKIKRILKKHSGRNAAGKITTRHQGGREKRYFRVIDFTRDKKEIPAKVVAIESDPNRGAKIALLIYGDGEKRYILAPVGLKEGAQVMAGEKSDVAPGNALPLRNIPIGTMIHNIELVPKKGGQLVRGAGVAAIILSKEEKFAIVKLPSGEQRRIPIDCYGTIGQVGNVEKKMINLGKAGRKRHLGIRPTVRGVAQNPHSHPHGGGEGRSGIGMPSPKSPWGKKTLGKRTRKIRKYSNKFIVRRRR